MQTISRKRVLGSFGALGASASIGSLLLPRHAAAAAAGITAIEWGGDVIDAMKQIEADQKAVQVNWALFQGGSGSVLPKRLTRNGPGILYRVISMG